MIGLGTALLTPDPPPGVWLLCGPPASGKSTFRRDWWQGPVVSPDELRLELFGTAFDPRCEGIIWTRVRRQVAALLAAGPGVLLDATNVRRADRRPWVRAAAAGGLPAYAIACWDPEAATVAELLRRNAGRPAPVPPERLAALAAAWQAPARSEGFAAVWTAAAGAGQNAAG